MPEIFMLALAILTLAVLIIRLAVRKRDVLNGRFFERSEPEEH